MNNSTEEKKSILLNVSNHAKSLSNVLGDEFLWHQDFHSTLVPPRDKTI